MKRLFAVIALILTASLASCAENNAQNKPAVTENTERAAGTAAPVDTTSENPDEKPEEKSAGNSEMAETSSAGTEKTASETTTTSPAASPAGTTEAGYPSAAELNVYYDERNREMENVCDGLYYHAEDNVKFVVLKCQDDLFAFCAEPVFSAWNILYREDLNLELENGEFAFLTADVIFASGGIDGRANQPEIRRVIDFQKTDSEHVLEYYSFPIWEEGGRNTAPMILFETGGNKYFLFRRRGGRRVETADGRTMYEQYNGWFAILDGKVTEYFDYSKYKFDDVIKLLSGEKLVTDGYDTEIMNSETIAVFRIGDKYYSFGTSIFLNIFPTPIYNDKLEPGLPEGYELNDGNCALIRADLKLLNGGGWVHVPMIDKIVKFEECDYDIFIERIAVSPIREYERKEDHQPDNVMFDRTVAGTWLIIVDDRKYMIYLQSYLNSEIKHEFVGSCDTLESTIVFIDGYKKSN